MIHFFVDSTASISPEFLEKHENVHVIPLFIRIGDSYVPDDVNLIGKVIAQSEATKKAIPTSQPSTGDFIEAFKTVPEEDDIIVLALTTAVSGTYNGAVLAARQSGSKRISVVHSRTTAVGMVQLLQDGLELAAAGKHHEEVAAEMQENAYRMHTSFTIATLDYLQRGGRIGKAAGLIGSILRIRPVIYLNENDEVDVLGKVRTEKKAIACLLEHLDAYAPCKRIGIVHIQNEEGAESLRQIVKGKYPDTDVTVSTGTAVLSAYLGPGLLGIIFESAKV